MVHMSREEFVAFHKKHYRKSFGKRMKQHFSDYMFPMIDLYEHEINNELNPTEDKECFKKYKDWSMLIFSGYIK